MFAVSVDSVPTNKAFAESLKVTKYAILSDFHPKGDVSKKFGVYLDDKGISARATVVVGKDGKVKWVKVNDLPAQRQNEEILKSCG